MLEKTLSCDLPLALLPQADKGSEAYQDLVNFLVRVAASASLTGTPPAIEIWSGRRYDDCLETISVGMYVLDEDRIIIRKGRLPMTTAIGLHEIGGRLVMQHEQSTIISVLKEFGFWCDYSDFPPLARSQLFEDVHQLEYVAQIVLTERIEAATDRFGGRLRKATKRYIRSSFGPVVDWVRFYLRGRSF